MSLCLFYSILGYDAVSDVHSVEAYALLRFDIEPEVLSPAYGSVYLVIVVFMKNRIMFSSVFLDHFTRTVAVDSLLLKNLCRHLWLTVGRDK